LRVSICALLPACAGVAVIVEAIRSFIEFWLEDELLEGDTVVVIGKKALSEKLEDRYFF
jgi:hypothetical protein